MLNGPKSSSATGNAANAPAGGDAVDALLPIVYGELHALAQMVLARNRNIDPPQTTSLVNDVYLRLANRGLNFRDRAHFLALAARAMRMVLIDRARRARAEKRGGGSPPHVLNEEIAAAADGPDLLALDEVLNRLAALDAAKAQIVELRFFGGLSVEETAEVSGMSPASVKREWTLAKAWLFRELSGERRDEI